MLHDLAVDDGVEDFSDDWQKGDRAVVLCKVSSLRFVDFDQLCQLQGVGISVFIYCSVEEGGEDWR